MIIRAAAATISVLTRSPRFCLIILGLFCFRTVRYLTIGTKVDKWHVFIPNWLKYGFLRFDLRIFSTVLVRRHSGCPFEQGIEGALGLKTGLFRYIGYRPIGRCKQFDRVLDPLVCNIVG